MNNLITELEAAINTERKMQITYDERDPANLTKGAAMDLYDNLWDAKDDTDTLCRKLAQISTDIYWKECHSESFFLDVTIQDCRERACDDVDKIVRNIKQRIS